MGSIKLVSYLFFVQRLTAMKFVLKITIFSIILFNYAMCKMKVMIDERTEKCTKPGFKSGLFDFSSFELIAETDTAIHANGSIKISQGWQSPLRVHVYFEKFDRGKWSVMAYDKHHPDFCTVMHDPKEPSYKFFKDCPACPAKAGVS